MHQRGYTYLIRASETGAMYSSLFDDYMLDHLLPCELEFACLVNEIPFCSMGGNRFTESRCVEVKIEEKFSIYKFARKTFRIFTELQFV